MRRAPSLPVCFFATLLTLAFAAACDSDPASPPPLTVQALTNQLAEIAGVDPPSVRVEGAIANLARQTCLVMAGGGGCGNPLPSPGPGGLAPAPGPGSAILSLLASNDRFRSEGPAWTGSLELPQAAAQPLGATCIWSVENDRWVGGPPLFGSVPDDRTRFEEYETQPGGPVVPLQATGGFFDVAPIAQNKPADPRSEINVEVQARQQASALVSLLLAGRVNPGNGDVMDLLMSGRSGSQPANALDYVFAVDRERVVNTIEIQDLLVVSRIHLSGNASFFVQKRNDPRQAVEFVFRLGPAGTTVQSGDVFVGGSRVATMSGDRQTPVLQLLNPASFAEDENLAFVYEQLLRMDVRVVDLFFFGWCIGANTPDVCNSMRSRLNVG